MINELTFEDILNAYDLLLDKPMDLPIDYLIKDYKI